MTPSARWIDRVSVRREPTSGVHSRSLLYALIKFGLGVKLRKSTQAVFESGAVSGLARRRA